MTTTEPLGISRPATTNSLPRLLAPRNAGLREHLDRFGALPKQTMGLAEEVDRSGLTGRGGAGFPTARKLQAMGRRGIVIANGTEGEPSSAKDATVLTRAPHLVLDGLLLVSRACAARRAVITVEQRNEAPVRAAIAERGDTADIEVRIAPHSFIAGEATAVANLIATGEAVPTDHTVRLTTRGVGGRPTLVQNVETLAHVALIARFGADWFRAIGSTDDPGSRLVTLTGDVRRSGVLEVPGGMRIDEVLRFAGTDPGAVQAVLVGGYHGAWVQGSRLDVALSRRALAPLGAAPGAGILMAIGHRRCGLHTTSTIVDYLATQSARQCGPCVNGLPALADAMRAVTGRQAARGVRDALHYAAVVTGRGSCHHPDGTARLVTSALDVFRAEVDSHAHGDCVEAR